MKEIVIRLKKWFNILPDLEDIDLIDLYEIKNDSIITHKKRGVVLNEELYVFHTTHNHYSLYRYCEDNDYDIIIRHGKLHYCFYKPHSTVFVDYSDATNAYNESLVSKIIK